MLNLHDIWLKISIHLFIPKQQTDKHEKRLQYLNSYF
jgi:hypothetical protein